MRRSDLTSFGQPHHHHAKVGSTNDLARELAIDGAKSGTVVTAAEQDHGRGRGDRRWSAPAGKALLYSAILAPLDSRHLLLPLSVPLAVCDAVEEVAVANGLDHQCQVKWPNDIWLDSKKLAGILIEARPPQWAVIGVGINVAVEESEFPGDLRWPAISIGSGVGVDEVLVALNRSLGSWVEASDSEVLGAFRSRDALLGRKISWEGEGSVPGAGIADGIDDRGNLMVAVGSGERISLGSGEVHLTIEV